MTDTQNIDDSEKLNIIFKEILGFPSTSENISYYEELNTKFNSDFFGILKKLNKPIMICFNDLFDYYIYIF